MEELQAGVEELVGEEWAAVVGGAEALLGGGAGPPGQASARWCSRRPAGPASLAFWRPSGSYWLHLAPLPALLQELFAMEKVCENTLRPPLRKTVRVRCARQCMFPAQDSACSLSSFPRTDPLLAAHGTQILLFGVCQAREAFMCTRGIPTI